MMTERSFIALSLCEGLNTKHLRELNRLLPIDELLSLKPSALRALPLASSMITSLSTIDWNRVDATQNWLKNSENHFITLFDPAYPTLLKSIARPPLLIYTKGQNNILKSDKIAIIGSRKASPQGIANSRAFAKHLAKAGLVIVSGLALGIDKAAHEGALDAGHTIAVLGSGLNNIYPRQHHDLANIIKNNNLLISEYPIDAPPKKHHFPRRNRIISGLSLATLVVEATKRSGSLITAYQAAEQGREVFAIPGSIRQTQHSGCHQLLKEGAYLAESPEDILNHLINQIDTNNLSLVLDRKAQKKYNLRHKSNKQLEPLYNKVLKTIADETLPADEIAKMCHLSLEKALLVLTELELGQYISAVAGGYRKNESE